MQTPEWDAADRRGSLNRWIDALLVHAESRDGISVLCCSTVAERSGEKLLLEAVRLDGDKLEGRFVHLFDGIDG